MARLLAVAGVRVALFGRTGSALDSVAGEIGENAIAIRCDVNDDDSLAAAVEKLLAHFGEAPDILVNSAGVFHIGSMHQLTVNEFAESMNTNLIAPFRLVRAFLPAMLNRGSGHIVTIGSVADRTVFPGNGAYAATKHGVRAMHEVLLAESRGSGVRATLVSPSAVNTNLWDPIDTESEDSPFPPRSAMLPAHAVARAVLYALEQPPEVNVDELRLSRS